RGEVVVDVVGLVRVRGVANRGEGLVSDGLVDGRGHLANDVSVLVGDVDGADERRPRSSFTAFCHVCSILRNENGREGVALPPARWVPSCAYEPWTPNVP